MNTRFCKFSLVVSAITIALITNPVAAEQPAADIGKPVAPFALPGVNGKEFRLAELKDHKAVVVVFLSLDCPIARSYLEPLSQMAKAYADRGAAVVGICPTEESPAKIAEWQKEFKVQFDVFKDDGLVATKVFGATCTPEAFVLDRELNLRYRGRVDDRWTKRFERKLSSQPAKEDLREALDSVLAGRPVALPVTEPVGCPIPRAKRAEEQAGNRVTFHRDVEPIVQRSCQECHRTGGAGPFNLLTYKDARKWADDIKEFTQERKMPPWKPVGGLPFVGERKLTAAEISIIGAWVDAGCPEGDRTDAPPPRVFSKDWALGEPDMILKADEDFILGANGEDLFHCFVLPTGLNEDRYVSAYELRPGNTRIVHHTLNFYDTTGMARQLDRQAREHQKHTVAADRGPGYECAMGIGFIPKDLQAVGSLGGWTPGIRAAQLPDGTGYLLPKGADVVIQVHYHRSGKEERDRPQIGLYFGKGEQYKPMQLVTLPGLVAGPKLRPFTTIPAGAQEFRVRGKVIVETDSQMYSVLPHMHMLGKSIHIRMTPPGSAEQLLVAVDDWDYKWQEVYKFQQAVSLKAGTLLEIDAVFDNSAGNPYNPFSPPRDVKQGPYTTDEMLYGFIGATSDAGGEIKLKPLTDPKDYTAMRP